MRYLSYSLPVGKLLLPIDLIITHSTLRLLANNTYLSYFLQPIREITSIRELKMPPRAPIPARTYTGYEPHHELTAPLRGPKISLLSLRSCYRHGDRHCPPEIAKVTHSFLSSECRLRPLPPNLLVSRDFKSAIESLCREELGSINSSTSRNLFIESLLKPKFKVFTVRLTTLSPNLGILPQPDWLSKSSLSHL